MFLSVLPFDKQVLSTILVCDCSCISAPVGSVPSSFVIVPEKMPNQSSLRVPPAYKPVKLIVGMAILTEAKS